MNIHVGMIDIMKTFCAVSPGNAQYFMVRAGPLSLTELRWLHSDITQLPHCVMAIRHNASENRTELCKLLNFKLCNSAAIA